MTRWRPMLRCEEGRIGGSLEEEEKRRREEKLSDEAVEKLGGGEGSTSNTLTKGKMGRERIYYVYGLLCTNYVVFMCIFYFIVFISYNTKSVCCFTTPTEHWKL